jgi:hypothetical protein
VTPFLLALAAAVGAEAAGAAVVAHAVKISMSSRQAATRWAMAGRAITVVHFPPEKVRFKRKKKQPTTSVALLDRGDTALLATWFWRVDYSMAYTRGARQVQPAV